MSFTAAAGGTYTIETGNLGPDCDTVLYLYASDGATQLAIDDDNGGEPLASRIDWTAPADGTYFVRAQQYGDSQSGDGTSYDLWVTGPQYIELLLGWNLIGFAGRKETAITTALVEIAGKYDEVLTYDAADAADPWKRYLPGTPAGLNEFTALQPGRGYWISMTAEGRLTINP
jgi:hypothetical protein